MTTPVLSGPSRFLINEATGIQQDPVVAGLGNGRFVAVWVDSSQDAPDTFGTALRGAIFNAAGEIIGTSFLVNSAYTGNQSFQEIAVLSDGRFVVT